MSLICQPTSEDIKQPYLPKEKVKGSWPGTHIIHSVTKLKAIIMIIMYGYLVFDKLTPSGRFLILNTTCASVGVGKGQ